LTGTCTAYEEMRTVYKILIEKPESKTLLRSFGRGLDDNIKMYLREIGCSDVNWFHLIQDKVHC